MSEKQSERARERDGRHAEPENGAAEDRSLLPKGNAAPTPGRPPEKPKGTTAA